MTSNRLHSLDLLRGVAIFGVVTFHVSAVYPIDHRVAQAIVSQGFYGVQLFFIVSAFTMCLMWDRRSNEERPALSFYIRRFFRIAPPFWLAVAAYIYLNGTSASFWAPDGIGLRQILSTTLFVHTFWPDTINSVVPGGWSIGVEMLFYLFFPLIISRKRGPTFYFVSAAILFLVAVLCVRPLYEIILNNYPSRELVREFLYFQFFNQAPIFLLGVSLYKIVTDEKRAKMWPIIIVATTWIVIAASLKFVLEIPAGPLFWQVVLLLLLISFFVLKLGMTLPPLNRLGALSYSIYLTHFAVLQAVGLCLDSLSISHHSFISFLLALSATLITCWLISSVIEVTIERFSSNIGKYLIDLLEAGARHRAMGAQ